MLVLLLSLLSTVDSIAQDGTQASEAVVAWADTRFRTLLWQLAGKDWKDTGVGHRTNVFPGADESSCTISSECVKTGPREDRTYCCCDGDDPEDYACDPCDECCSDNNDVSGSCPDHCECPEAETAETGDPSY